MAPPKRVTNRVSVTRRKPEDRIKYFQENNSALAKKLSHWRENYNMVLKERNQLQKENMEVCVQNKNLECRLKNVVMWTRGLLECIVKGSEFATNIICHADLEQLALIARQNRSANDTDIESQAKKRLSDEFGIQNPVVNLTRLPAEVIVNSRRNVEKDPQADSLSTTVADDDLCKSNGETETEKELEEGELQEEDDEDLEEEEDDDNNAVENQPNGVNVSPKRLNTLIEESSILNSTTCTSPEETLLPAGVLNEVKIALTPFDKSKSGPLKRKSSSGKMSSTSPQTVTKRSKRNAKSSNTRIPVQTTSPDGAVSSCSSKSSLTNNQTPSLDTVIDNLSDNLDSEQASSKRNSFELSNSGCNRTLLSPGFSQRKSQSMTTSTPFNTNTSSAYNDSTENTFPTTPVKHTRNAASRKRPTILSSINTSAKGKLKVSSPQNVSTRKKLKLPSPQKTVTRTLRTQPEIVSSPPRRQPRSARPKSLKEVSLRQKLRRK